MSTSDRSDIKVPPPPPVQAGAAHRSRGVFAALLAVGLVGSAVVFSLPAPGSPALEAPPPLLVAERQASAPTIPAAIDSPTRPIPRPSVPPAPAIPQTSSKSPNVPPSSIMVSGLLRSSRVRVDGRDYTTNTIGVSAGRHVLTVLLDGVAERSETILVRVGETYHWSASAPGGARQARAIRPSSPVPPAGKSAGPGRSISPTCRSLMEAKAWQDAFPLCTREAEAGRSSAQRDLGELFEQGRGTARSESEAAGWYAKAAEGGDQDAMFRIAVAYDKGRGVKKEGALALLWYTRAATAGMPEAQFIVGQAYEKGKLGAHKDKSVALAWYRKAAAQGHTQAAERVKDLSK